MAILELRRMVERQRNPFSTARHIPTREVYDGFRPLSPDSTYPYGTASTGHLWHDGRGESARPSPPASCTRTGRSSLSGDSAIGFSGMEMETLVRYNFPVKIVVLNNGGLGPGMPEIPNNPMFNMKPNSLIYGARYDKVMEAFGG